MRHPETFLTHSPKIAARTYTCGDFDKLICVWQHKLNFDVPVIGKDVNSNNPLKDFLSLLGDDKYFGKKI
jgi:hypothetical protein